MTKVLIPGSFDPATLGHLDIIRRASAMFDSVTVLAMQNAKKQSVFSLNERAEMLREMTSGLENVTVDCYKGLCADYIRQNGINIILKGIRSEADIAYEQEIASINRMLCGVETVFLPSLPEYSHISTSVGLQLLSFGADVSAFFTAGVKARLEEKFAK